MASSVARSAPSPGFRPRVGRLPTPSIPQPSRFLESGLGVGSLRAGRQVPSCSSHTAVAASEFAPLSHQSEGTGLPALGSWGNRYGLPPPLTTRDMPPPPPGSQSFAPSFHVTSDMGTHAGVGYPGVAPHTVVTENPFPRGSYSLGYQPPENPSLRGSYFLGHPLPREGSHCLGRHVPGSHRPSRCPP